MDREHFSKQFDTELNEIRGKLLEMGGKVEAMIASSMQSLLERDSELAERTIAFDREINHLEMEIDDTCLGVLARRQPTARDLRFLTLALKIVTDLERIGDQCAGIAKNTKELIEEPVIKPYIDLPRMAQAAATMVREALDAFMSGDVALAIKVCEDDQRVDDLNEQFQLELLRLMMDNPSAINSALKINNISKSLERIADHATNVAEMVIFMVSGKDIRHTIA